MRRFFFKTKPLALSWPTFDTPLHSISQPLRLTYACMYSLIALLKLMCHMKSWSGSCDGILASSRWRNETNQEITVLKSTQICKKIVSCIWWATSVYQWVGYNPCICWATSAYQWLVYNKMVRGPCFIYIYSLSNWRTKEKSRTWKIKYRKTNSLLVK